MRATLTITLDSNVYNEKEFQVLNATHADLIAQGYRLKFPNCHISWFTNKGNFNSYIPLQEEIDSLKVDLGLITFKRYAKDHYNLDI